MENSIKESLSKASQPDNTETEINDGYIFFTPDGKPVSDERILHNALIISKLVNVVCNLTNDELALEYKNDNNINYYTTTSDQEIVKILIEVPELKKIFDLFYQQSFEDELSRDRFKMCILLKAALNLNVSKDENQLRINKCKLLEITYMCILEFIDNYSLDPEKVLNAVKLNDYLFNGVNEKNDEQLEQSIKQDEKEIKEDIKQSEEDIKNLEKELDEDL